MKVARVAAAGASALGLAPPAWAADESSLLVPIAIVVAILLFVVGLGIRVLRSARMSAGWQAFIDRRKAQGRSTRWAEWDDEDDDGARRR